MQKVLIIIFVGFLFNSSVSAQMFKKDAQSSSSNGILAVPTLNYNRSHGLEIGGM